MEITQVKIFPVQEDKLKAFVSIVLDHCFMVNDIKVIQGKDGLFLSMPSRRKKNGEFKDVAHPLNNQTRRLLEERVLREYRLEVDDPTPRRPDREAADGVTEPRNAHPAQASPDDWPPGDRRPDDRRPGDRRPGNRRPGDRRPGDRRPGDRPSGDGRAADRPAGVSGVAPVAAAAGAADVAAAAGAADKTLEEVQELHLSDSFWSV